MVVHEVEEERAVDRARELERLDEGHGAVVVLERDARAGGVGRPSTPRRNRSPAPGPPLPTWTTITASGPSPIASRSAACQVSSATPVRRISSRWVLSTT